MTSATMNLAPRQAAVEQLARRLTIAMESWTSVAVIVGAYLAFGGWSLATDRYLHDEGLLTWIFSSFLLHDPIPSLFFLKIKPALSLMNLPGTALGIGGFFYGHLLLCALGIVLSAAAAQRMGIRRYGLVALLVASSPMFLAGGPAGISNCDGAVILAGALLALASSTPSYLAGLILGVLPLVRFELGLPAIALVLATLPRARTMPFAAGLLSLPVIYWLGGSLYHRTLGWPALFFPAPWHWGGEQGQFVAVAMTQPLDILTGNVGLTTAFPLLAFVPVRSLRAEERWMLGGTLLFIVAISVFPMLRSLFGFSERYYLAVLPMMAILIVRAMDGHEGPPARGNFMVALTVGCAIVCVAMGGLEWRFILSLVILGGVSLLLRAGLRESAVAGLALYLLCSGPYAAQWVDIRRVRDSRPLDEAMAWLGQHESARTQAIYTNLHLLDVYAARSGHMPGLHVHGLIQLDVQHEIQSWTNASNGQRARIWSLLRWRFYGPGVMPSALVRTPPSRGSLLLLDAWDPRTNDLFPEAWLDAHTRPLYRTRVLRISEFR